MRTGFENLPDISAKHNEIHRKLSLEDDMSGVRAYRNTSTQSIPDSTWTKVQFNAENYDNQNEFDSTTNYRFTALKVGYYQVNCFIRWNTPVVGTRYIAELRKNGSAVARCELPASATSAHTVFFGDIVSLVANDYLEVYVYQNSGGADTVDFLSNLTFISIHKLS